MKTLYKLSLKMLYRNLTNTLFTLLNITLAVVLSSTIILFAYSMVDSYDQEIIADSSRENISIFGLDQEQRERLINQLSPELEQVIYFNNDLVFADGDSEHRIITLTYDDFIRLLPSSNQQEIKITSGKLPQNENEIIVSQQSRGNLKIGDRITPGESPFIAANTNNSTPYEFVISGFFEGYSSYSAVRFARSQDNLTQISLMFKSGSKRIEQHVKDVLKTFENPSYLLLVNDNYNEVLGMSTAFFTVRRILISFGTALSLFLSLATLSMIFKAFQVTLSKQTHDFGLLRSVGATKRQIKKILLAESYLLIIAGIACGFLISGFLTSGIITYLNHISTTKDILLFTSRLYLSIPYQAFLIPCVLTLIITYIPTRKVIRQFVNQTSIESIRKINQNQKRDTGSISAHVIKSLARRTVKEEKQLFKGVQHALMISITLFILVSFASQSFFDALSKPYIGNEFNLILTKSFHPNSDLAAFINESEAIASLLDQENDIIQYQQYSDVYNLHIYDLSKEPILYSKDLGAKVRAGFSPSTRMIVLPDREYRQLIENAKLDPGSNPMILFNHVDNFLIDYSEYGLYESYSGSILDITATSIYLSSGIDLGSEMIRAYSQAVPLAVLNQAIDPVLPGSDLSAPFPEPIIYTSQSYAIEALADFYTDDQQRVDGSLDIENTTKIETMDAAETKGIIENLDPGINIDNYDKNYQELMLAKRIIRGASYILTGYIAIMCLVNLINSALISLDLRRKDLAVLNSVGMTGKQIRQMLLFESIGTLLKPTISGLVIGVGSSYLIIILMNYLSAGSTGQFVYSFDAGSLLISLLFVLIFIILQFISSYFGLGKANSVTLIK